MAPGIQVPTRRPLQAVNWKATALSISPVLVAGAILGVMAISHASVADVDAPEAAASEAEPTLETCLESPDPETCVEHIGEKRPFATP